MTEPWQSLSMRRGKRQIDGPYEGVPLHLEHALGEWLRERFGWTSRDGMNDHLMSAVAVACRIHVTATYAIGGISDQIFAAMSGNDDLFLDVLDAALHLGAGNASALRNILRVGGSAWTVRADGRGLERRVPEATAQAFAVTTAPSDSVSEELREAWGAAFGRNPDPSDAWDHAIKAVEDLLIPIVVPKVAKANLGTVAGELKANPDRWEFGLPGNAGRGNGETLEGLIRHIWPNPDRHGGAAKREPGPDEADAVVQIAVLVVGLCRGRLVKKP